MQKGNPKQQQGTSKKQAEFDSVFEKFAKQLPKEYVTQFKKVENKTAAEKVKKREAQRTGKIEHVVKTAGNKHGDIVNISKLLEDDGILEVKETPREIAQQVARFRAEKNLTRDQLAKKISEPVSDVNDLENCVGLYKPNLVLKIERALGVKIDRPWKKNN
jgi:ribosome-binding protein aMBF1 (putative translation factor)